MADNDSHWPVDWSMDEITTMLGPSSQFYTHNTVPQEAAINHLPLPDIPNVQHPVHTPQHVSVDTPQHVPVDAPQPVQPPTSTMHAMGALAVQHSNNALQKPKKRRVSTVVLCPFCNYTSTCKGGATGGKSYAYLCDNPVCNQMFNRSIVPNANGEYEITRSGRALQNQPKRSGEYACGKCGFKPKKGHICPYQAYQPNNHNNGLVAPIAATGNNPVAHIGMASIPIVIDPLQATLAAPLVSTATGVVASQDLSIVKGLETPGVDGSINGRDVHDALKLERLRVCGDGSCWVYAILAPIGLCEHANNDKTNVPTPRDRFMDKECREWCFQYLTLHANALGLTPKEQADILLIRKEPTYPLEAEADYGEFGTIHTITALAAFFKVSCVVWNTTTIDQPTAKQQVIKFLPDNKEPNVEEHAMSPNDILRFSLANPVIHVEWDGIDHYSALVGKSTVSVDRHAHHRIITSAYQKIAHDLVRRKRKAPAKKAKSAIRVEPAVQAQANSRSKIPRMAHAPGSDESTHKAARVTMRALKPPRALQHPKVPRTACLSGWTAISNKICPRYAECCTTDSQSLSELSFEGLSKGFNAIFIYKKSTSSASLFVYLKYAFEVLEEHCLDLGDATGTLYLHNASHSRLNKTPPRDIKGCFCNKHYIGDASKSQSELQCDTCHAWYHKECIGLTDKEFARLTADNLPYTCSFCS